MKKATLFLSIILLCVFTAQAQTGTSKKGAYGVKTKYFCPGRAEVTYNLNVSKPTDATLLYSTDGGRTYKPCTTVSGDLSNQSSGTGKTITWNMQADGLGTGFFLIKVEVPPEPECVMINNVCWATRNVDAPGTFAANPEDAGMFYQWDSTVGWSSTDPLVSTDGSTWNSNNNSTASTWQTTNNVCPTGYRVPTQAELQSLVSAGSTWVTTPAAGRVFGTAPNTLFLPAAGYRSYGTSALGLAGSYGDYWSSTVLSTSSYYLAFYSGSVPSGNTTNRAYGFSVRCVAE